MRDKIILVDQDGTIAGFDERFLEIWRERYPERPYVPLSERKIFETADEYSDEDRPKVREIFEEPGFFRGMLPLEGAVEALKGMQNQYDVFICTSPLREYRNCVEEKYEWVEQHLGKDWTKRIILTKDKTLVMGNILIDDKPKITGLVKPTWEQILYTRPYNQQFTDRRRLTWRNWKEVLDGG